jgi:retinol-binding protein 3
MSSLFDDNRKQNQHLPVRPAIVQTACLLLLFAVSYGFAQPAIPSTPAGQTLQAWLDAFNSGDRAKLATYVKNTDPSESVEGMMGFHSQTGGFNLLSIESSEPLSIIFRVKEKGGPTEAVGVLQVKDTSPPTVDRFLIRALPPGAVIEDIKLDAAERQRVIDSAIAMLNEFYVYADVAKKMEDALRAHQKQGDYDAITNGNAFATLLTTHLRDVSHDRHLGVDYNPFKVPAGAPGPRPPTAEDQARMRRQLERSNCAFEKAEILSPNIGYLKFNGFMDPGICGATVAAAMNFLAHTDAIIFDLRENGGGDPAMVTFISSYLFDHSTHLNDLYNRKADTTTQYWTTPFVPGERFIDKPVFVLTSKFTFSGAEEFTYNLKNLKRATIVGETTGGGAHPVSGHPIDDHFSIRTPFARAINPISKTNWEGTGIEPDVKVSAAEAPDTAKKLAVEKIQQKQPDGSPKKAAPSSN